MSDDTVKPEALGPPTLELVPGRAAGPARPRLLHFELRDKLGEGGMGTVYEAEDLRLRRRVAIKRVSPAASRDATARERLLREARAASALSHPCLVTIHSIEQSDEGDFIVMELVEGSPLSRLLAGGPLDPARVAAIGADLADGLACAHAAGFVHRDLKPDNIVITPSGRPKLLDFGIVAAPPTAARPLTMEGALVGTPRYMSPEQTRAGALDGRSDVFALGVVLYEAATGRRAFEGDGLDTLFHAICAVDPPPPAALRPELPRALDAVIRRAMEKDPARRYPGAREMAAALRLAERGLPEAAGRAAAPALFVGREDDLARLDRLVAAAAAGAGALVLVTGEAGAGKSSLVDVAAARAAAALPALAFGRGRCLAELGAGEAYLSLLGALEELLAGPHAALVREALLAVAPRWALELRAGEREALEREALGTTRERMIRELGDLVAALAARLPLLLVLEDLHWADPSTIAALVHLARRLPRQRALIVATLRADEVAAPGHPLRAVLADWRARDQLPELRLGELTCAEVARWLDVRFAPHDFPAELAPLVHARTDGHALFVAGMLDFFVEQGLVRRDADGWHAGGLAPDTLAVPEALRDLLRAKLDATGGGDRAILEHAAVQGVDFLAAIVADQLGMDELAVEERLEQLARGGRLVRRAGDEELPDGSLTTRWRFAHGLYRDVLHADLPARRRTLLHLGAGRALLARSAGGSGRLALHFELGRDFRQATAHHAQAGDKAMQLCAAVEAERHYARAMACCERLPPEERERGSVGLAQQRATALTAMGRYDTAIDELSVALARARRTGDAELEGASRVALADVMVAAHRQAEAVPHIEEALALAARAGLPGLRGDALALRALERLIVGELDACGAALDEMGDSRPLALHLRGLLAYFRSDYPAAAAAFAEAAERNERALADGLLLMESRMFEALALANLGRLGEALRRLEATLELARRNANLAMVARIENSAGWIERELGRIDEALERDRRAAEAGREAEESEAEANALLNVAEDELARGEEPRAAGLGRVAELADGDAWLSWRYRLRLDAAVARAALARGDLDAAAAAAGRLREAASRQRAAKHVAVAADLAARIAAARGDLPAARAEIAAAREVLARAPCPVVAWRVEALAAELDGDAAARGRAAAIVAELAAGLDGPRRAAFLAWPPVARLRAT